MICLPFLKKVLVMCMILINVWCWYVTIGVLTNIVMPLKKKNTSEALASSVTHYTNRNVTWLDPSVWSETRMNIEPFHIFLEELIRFIYWTFLFILEKFLLSFWNVHAYRYQRDHRPFRSWFMSTEKFGNTGEWAENKWKCGFTWGSRRTEELKWNREWVLVSSGQNEKSTYWGLSYKRYRILFDWTEVPRPNSRHKPKSEYWSKIRCFVTLL